MTVTFANGIVDLNVHEECGAFMRTNAHHEHPNVRPIKFEEAAYNPLARCGACGKLKPDLMQLY